MSSCLQRVIKANILPRGSYPQFVKNNTILEVIMGSEAYGIATSYSDKDIYGVCVPSKEILFPHEAGKIWGFDEYNDFKVWQNHHIRVDDITYDFSIYNIVSYFKLLSDGNPNIIDSLFVPRECIVFSTPIAENIIFNRNIFLHSSCFQKFIGYAYSQISKLERKPEGKRIELYNKFGYDVKYASHAVRLLLEVEDILENGTLDLRKNKEILKSIRAGNWKKEEVQEWVRDKEQDLHKAVAKTSLPKKPNMEKIKQLLIECLDQFYGTATNTSDKSSLDKTKIQEAIDLLSGCL